MTPKKPEPGPQTHSMQAIPEAAEGVDGQIILRPDGYYWCAPDDMQEIGPFLSVEEAQADMQAASGEAPEPGETLQEAESELGISDWIDPDTGEPAEGWSNPHLDRD
ncbi:MAG: hypothetical protein ACO214_13310 [Hylemonella sp.]